MIRYIILIKRDSGVLLFDKKLSSDFPDIKSDLLSGMLVALRNFTKELEIGELSTFFTFNQKVSVAVTPNLVVVIILDKDDSEVEWQRRALLIGDAFEKAYNLKEWKMDLGVFDSFHETLSTLLTGFQWKKFSLPLINMDASSLEGFLIYDKNQNHYYEYFSDNRYIAEELIRKAEGYLESEVQTTQADKTFLFIRISPMQGGILVLDSHIPQDRMQRYAKTLYFLIQHLQKTYIFQDNLKAPA
ncbi:MAG: hypothetical protein LUQ65_04470, partial [Candidatus Helarchaeota archaeon]|nr:hypothetical protein [Candidatus Helarchaeota archaeon]